MDRAGWMDVWRLALSVASREPAFVQIALVLGVALVAVMCLEGLYASLRPARYAARIARNHGEVSPAARETPEPQSQVYAAAPAPVHTLPPVPVARRAQRPALKPARPKFRRDASGR